MATRQKERSAVSAITIEGRTARLVTPEGSEVSMSVEKLFQQLVPAQSRRPLTPLGVRYADSAGPIDIWVYEIPLGVRQLRWISEGSPRQYGNGSRYRMVRLALPYLVVFAVFDNGIISDMNECFFRVTPMEDERHDELYFPALLNCSRFEPAESRPLSWICTQKLDRSPLLAEKDRARRMRLGLRILCHCLLETGFNYSSDVHEYASWFSETRKVDQRVSSVDAWEKATEKDPLFVLDVPWLPAGLTVEKLVERIFTNRNVRRRGFRTAGDLARVMLHEAGRRRSRS